MEILPSGVDGDDGVVVVVRRKRRGWGRERVDEEGQRSSPAA